MSAKQWNLQQFCKNDIFKPDFHLTAKAYMTYAYRA